MQTMEQWRDWLWAMTGKHPQRIMEYPDIPIAARYFDALLTDAEAYAEERVRRERERIYNDVASMATEISGPELSFGRILDRIRSRGAAPAPKLERMRKYAGAEDSPSVHDLADKVNECIDAIESLRRESRA